MNEERSENERYSEMGNGLWNAYIDKQGWRDEMCMCIGVSVICYHFGCTKKHSATYGGDVIFCQHTAYANSKNAAHP